MKLRITALIVLAMACIPASVVHAQSKPATPKGWSLVFYDKYGYEGNTHVVHKAMPDVGTLNRKMKSVVVNGRWQLCDGRNFTGYCVTLQWDIANLKAYGFAKPIQSLRPIVPKIPARKPAG
jgi:hypothetical protein